MTNNRPQPTAGTPQTPVAEPSRYAYFISVMDTARGGLRISQIEVFRVQRITTLQDVQDVQEMIRRDMHLPHASVLGCTLLRKVPASDAQGRQ
ncbi:hypothetical protein [Actinoplanes couchii]|uniref:Uncharacterized protein n=1 Tax=Actinoplanes couchii TaxID=403638 RepID=A0ABQ3X3C4_9ACTN|nr:hypothetical protein [Actinoplanes couchii]MDR6322784.1 hypothetical protein [Actinoplanes couchii]GID53023.1 hypothetical protein Aco03nite_014270 [Actinoplanes couchii]